MAGLEKKGVFVMARVTTRHSTHAAGKAALAVVLGLALSVPYFGPVAPDAYAESGDSDVAEAIGEAVVRQDDDLGNRALEVASASGDAAASLEFLGTPAAPFEATINLGAVGGEMTAADVSAYAVRDASVLADDSVLSEGDWLYETDGSGAALLAGYTGSASSVTLPEQLGGYPVIGVRYNARGFDSVSSITFPACYEFISGWAFTGYYNLKQVQFASGSRLRTVGPQAFGNTGLSEFVMPASLRNVGYGTFHGCPNLTKIVFNQDLEPLIEHRNISSGSESFQYDEPCAFAPYSPVDFVVPSNSKNYKAEGGALYSKDGSILYQLSPTYAGSSFSVPAGVVSIGREAFKGLDTLQTVDIPSSVKSIFEEAFSFSGLTSLTIPDSVEQVYGRICFRCTDLQSVAIGSGVTELGSAAGWECFFGCSSLSNVALGESLKLIGNACFAETALTSIDIPASVEQLNYGAFGDNPKLTKVTGAEGLRYIYRLAFRGAGISSFPFGDNLLFVSGDVFTGCSAFDGVYPSYLEKTSEGDYVSYGKVVVDGTDMNAYAYQVLDLVNRERANAGLRPLVMDEELLKSAMLRAGETSVFWDHTRPNGDDCFTVSPKAYGENIAAGQWSPDAVMESWMNSPGHRGNILGESWNSIGIGCFKSSSGMLYWVQLFGTSTGSNPAPRADEASQYRVFVNPDFLDPYFVAEPVGTLLGDWMCLDKGTSYPMDIYVHNEGYPGVFTPVNPLTFAWGSSNGNVVSVAEPGVFAARSQDATARVTATFGNTEYEFRVLVGHNPNRLFYDVDNHWGEGWIMAAQERGLVSGKLDGEGNLTGEFAPDEDVTRGQFAVILYRNEFPDSNATDDPAAYEKNATPLTDLGDYQYYTAAVNWAYSEGIITGDTTDDGSPAYTVRPNDPMKRQDAATMIARYAKSKGLAASANPAVFGGAPDAGEVAEYAAPFVAWCYENGIMTGDTTTGKLNPTAPTLRAAISKISVVTAEVIERQS